MARTPARILREQAIEQENATGDVTRKGRRAVKSVTVNLTESPLGWLYSRGLVSRRQFDAGERLRSDWERAQLAPRVTMVWDASPLSSGRSGSAPDCDLGGAQIDARRRFDDAIASAGAGLADILWRVVAPAKGCAMPRRRSAGRHGPASWC